MGDESTLAIGDRKTVTIDGLAVDMFYAGGPAWYSTVSPAVVSVWGGDDPVETYDVVLKDNEVDGLGFWPCHSDGDPLEVPEEHWPITSLGGLLAASRAMFPGRCVGVYRLARRALSRDGDGFDYRELDLGVQGAVRALHAAGFITLDSGDGRSKWIRPDYNPCVYPASSTWHVWLAPVETEQEATALTERLQAWLSAAGENVALPAGVCVERLEQGPEGGHIVGLVGPDSEFRPVEEALHRAAFGVENSPAAVPEGRALTDDDKDAVLAAVGRAWKRSPCLRLGQLIVCALGAETSEHVFHVEDGALARKAKGFGENREENGNV